MVLFSEAFILARNSEGKETIWTEFDYLFVLFYQGKPRINQRHGMNIFKTLVTRARKPSLKEKVALVKETKCMAKPTFFNNM